MSMTIVLALIPSDEVMSVELPPDSKHALTQIDDDSDAGHILDCAKILADALCRSNKIQWNTD